MGSSAKVIYENKYIKIILKKLYRNKCTKKSEINKFTCLDGATTYITSFQLSQVKT